MRQAVGLGCRSYRMAMVVCMTNAGPAVGNKDKTTRKAGSCIKVITKCRTSVILTNFALTAMLHRASMVTAKSGRSKGETMSFSVCWFL